jgi:hypothetical protein
MRERGRERERGRARERERERKNASKSSKIGHQDRRVNQERLLSAAWNLERKRCRKVTKNYYYSDKCYKKVTKWIRKKFVFGNFYRYKYYKNYKWIRKESCFQKLLQCQMLQKCYKKLQMVTGKFLY